MPKVKSHKGTSKRFKVTKSGQIMHRTSGQNHFNSRESGKVTKNKRTDSSIAKVSENIKVRIPYK
jgi:large subunit ribosomal protein L35